MKISVIGGGSAYTPGLAEGLVAIHKEVPFTEVWLMDIDAPKLNTVGKVVEKIINDYNPDIRVCLTENRVEAIKDSAFILCQIRVGGLKGRVIDEKIPLKYNCIGQETCGAGGFAMALRSIPVMMDIAKDIEKYAPEGWLINYSNPSGMVAAALAKHSKIKAVSICDVPIGIQHYIAKALKVSRKRVDLDYVGLNHYGWFRKVSLLGKDVSPMLRGLAKRVNIANFLSIDDAKTKEELEMSLRIFNKLGFLPSPYLQYYYLQKESLEKQLNSPKTRGEVVLDIEKELLQHFDEVNSGADKLWKARGGQWHSELMVSILSSIYNDKKEEYIINVLNNGSVPGMADDDCVEIPCFVDKKGITPKKVAKPDIDILGQMQLMAAYEKLTVEAAIEGSYEKALKALNMNPLVPSLEIAEKILDEYMEAHGDFIKLKK